MCWFYMGIAQIVLDPPIPSVKQANVEKSAPKHPGKSLHPRAMWEKSAQNHPVRPLTPPPLRAMPIWKQHISKRGFP